MLYHASRTGGIVRLEPRVSNHGVPLVYLSAKRENVLPYLSNAVERYCRETGFAHTGEWTKWGPYGFTQDGRLRLEEYYPNALEQTYRGVSAYIYAVDAGEGVRPLEGIPDAYVSEQSVPVARCEYIPDAYAEIMASAGRGEIVIQRFEDMSPAMAKWNRDTILREYADNPQKEDYRHFLRGKFPFILDGICI